MFITLGQGAILAVLIERESCAISARRAQENAPVNSGFKFRHSANIRALPNSPAVHPSYR